MRPARAAGWLSRSLGVVLTLLVLAGGGWPPSQSALAGQAAPAAAHQLLLPLVIHPPLPTFLPLVLRPQPPATVDLSVSRIEIIQGVTMAGANTVQVANRPALLRVFVTLTGAGSQPGVTARLTRYIGGAPQDSLNAGPIAVLDQTQESSLAETLNFNLPNNWLAAGTSYVLQLDPANSIRETNEANNQFPVAGQASFNFQDAPTLNVVIVPIHYARSGAPATDPPTGDLSYATWMPIKVYPVARINYSLHASFTYSGDLRPNNGSGWEDLLHQLAQVHGQEDPGEHEVYFGLVDSVGADGCGGGCIAGIGYVNRPPSTHGYLSKTAVGFAGFSSDRTAASPVLTHEIGHNFGRDHAPCGTSDGVDGNYPYPNASIGQWGYDNATSQLFDPNQYHDYMSYCDPTWTSDYTYHAIFSAWSWVANPYGTAVASPAAAVNAWVVSGFFDQTGHWQVAPAHVQALPAAALVQSGPLRLELLGAAGQVLAAQAFTSVNVSVDFLHSGFYQQGFRVAVPSVPGATGFRILRGDQTLYQRAVSGPAPQLAARLQGPARAGSTQLSWSLAAGPAQTRYSVSISRDGGQTWQALAVDQPQLSIVPPAAAGQGGGLLRVQASDGVRTDTRIYDLASDQQ
jgi:hypothetical protein